MKTQLAFVGFAFCIALTECDQAPTTHHWKEITRLTDAALEIHFVVVERSFAGDRHTLEDAGDSLCKNDPCQIGFFAHRNDVPQETLAADFFQNKGWENRHEIALFFRNRKSDVRTLKWNCNLLPQPFLNDCLEPPNPSTQVLEAAQKRGPLNGLGKLRFGTTLQEAVQLLGGDKAVTVLDQDNGRAVVRTRTTLYGRPFNAFYNVTSDSFSAVLLQWSDSINESACATEAQKIAGSISRDYGKQDSFTYFDSDRTTFLYSWLFANGASIKLDRVEKKKADCSLNLNFNAKSDSS